MSQKITPGRRDPVVCSDMYKLLSIGFRYPAPERFKIFQNGEFLDEIMGNISSIPGLNTSIMGNFSLIKHATKITTLAEFETEFTRVFDAAIPVPSCPPYEGIYYGKPRSAVMLEVSEFYNCFGLRMSQEEGKREFPDHISAELEFLHFLAFKEVQAAKKGDEKTFKGYLLAQKDFLERHLVRWVPEFCDKLQNSTGIPFYAWLARITSRFIISEHELLTGINEKKNKVRLAAACVIFKQPLSRPSIPWPVFQAFPGHLFRSL